MKTAFITGTTGQDGSYLTELLLEKEYEVHGLVRRTSAFNRERIDHIHDPRFLMHYGDMMDQGSLMQILQEVHPDEVYHLAAQSHVGISFRIPAYTNDVNVGGTINLLEAIRQSDGNPRVYNACTSEVFGGCRRDGKITESTPFNPRSPYATSKLGAYHVMKNYMEEYGLRVWNGFLFNHESPRRGENFITRKVTLSIARYLTGKQNQLRVGNLDACRDWGFAPEYVNAMWMMLQSRKPDDFVIATGETHSVQELILTACAAANVPHLPVTVDDCYIRPVDVEYLCGDAGKAKRLLGWEPAVRFRELVDIMMKNDMEHEGV